MPISYNVYKNDGRGGEVAYASPVALTTALTFACGPLDAPSDTTFAVRAVDPRTGIEEANTDARARVVLDASGNEVTNRPERVRGLSARPMKKGTCRVTWGYVATARAFPPVRFDVFLTPGSSPDYSNPAASVPFAAGTVGYECTLSGLADRATYAVAVRAIGPSLHLAGEPEVVSIFHAAARLQGVESLVGASSA